MADLQTSSVEVVLPEEVVKNAACTEAEWSKFVLRALINYHDRMTMCDQTDPFNRGLRYALQLVEKEIQK